MRMIIFAIASIALAGCLDPGNRTPALELIKVAEKRSYEKDLVQCKAWAKETHLRNPQGRLDIYDSNVQSCLSSMGHKVNLTHTRPSWVND